MRLDPGELQRVVEAALAEDLGTRGDITTHAVVDWRTEATGHFVARQDLILAGLPVAREVYRRLAPSLEFVSHFADGQAVGEGTQIASVHGQARPILSGERTALNFLMRMCGIATVTRQAVEEVADSGTRILDTRKTVPGLRGLDKYAVAVGGASNHRMGLYDAVMIKDTHLHTVSSIAEAVRRARERGHRREAITVEVRDLHQLEQAIEAGAGRVLLDNMDPGTIERAVAQTAGRVVLEASGGLRPGRLAAIAATGVDCLSLGWLTHSAPSADLALELERSF